jgi:hypothetical protein
MRRLLLAGCVAIATVGVFAASERAAHAGPKSGGLDPEARFFVTSVTPERDRHVMPDLSDPGVNNVIVVRFSTYPDVRDLVDVDGNFRNGLGAKCGLADNTLAIVPASASVYRNILTINPFSATRPVLAQGRYTLTFKSSVRSGGGRLLNDGAAGFVTRFSIGAGTYPPVLLRASPRAGESGVGPRRALVATFDEPLDEASAVASVHVEDRGVVPPAPVAARVRLARRGRALVVTPSARSGWPRGAELALVIAGQGSSTDGSAALLKETGGRAFTRDRGLGWIFDPFVPALYHSRYGDFDDVTGLFTLTFRTRGVVPRR